jgi:hypothetical protein
MPVRHAACVILALFPTACTDPPRGAQAGWPHGAQRAWGIGPVDAAALSAAAAPCMATPSAQAVTGQRCVAVRFWHGRPSFTEVAEAPAELTLQAGDELALWPAACAQGHPARIARILAARRA